jgi:N-methylhydantoinase A
MKTIAVETGGTFTDFIMVDGSRIATLKVLSTPSDPAVAVFKGLDEMGINLEEVHTLLHGSTVATNSVLERKGASVVFITTEGFRDILGFQRELKDHNYDIYYQKPQPLVSRDCVLEISERIGPDGQVWLPLDLEEATKQIFEFFSGKSIDAVAICFLHSYINNTHEHKVKEIIADQYPKIHTVASSDILPEFREYERASTATINAFVVPTVNRYISNIENELAKRGFDGNFHIMQSSGGILPSFLARVHGVRTIMSGPAAGVIGATQIATRTGVDNIITLDMGGTSTDVCLVTRGKAEITTEGNIDRLPIRVPMIDIVTVGAGGGSIAWLDPGELLRVGPQSAGADPGPACYGKGGQKPTVTDAYVVKGLVRPDNFLGGKMKLHNDSAVKVIESLGELLGLSRLEAADAVYRIATANMVFAMRLVSVERGYDPRDYTLVTFGGAGGLHAAYLADELGTAGALIPPAPGLLSAYGLLVAKFQRDYVQTDISAASQTTVEHVIGVFEKLEARAAEELTVYQLDGDSLSREWSVDMRYKGQAYELNVPADRGILASNGLKEIVELFHTYHKRRYGHSSLDKEVELVNYRLMIRGGKGDSDLQLPVSGVVQPVRMEGTVYLDGQHMTCSFYKRETLPAGFELEGPVVIEEDTATTLVPPGWTGTIDGYGNIWLRKGDASEH